MTDNSLSSLLQLTDLEELSTDGVQLTDKGIAQLTGLTNLRSVSFFHPSMGMKGFDGRGFASLKALPNLEKLTIAGTPFNDRGMAAVAEITQLREFQTWHTYQTQAGNQFLTKLPGLKFLRLGQRLRRYDGSSNALSLDDSTFDVLVELKALESLTLDESRLSLTSLRRLSGLPWLKKLELLRIDISAKEIDVLKSELPSATVNWKPLTDIERSKLTSFLEN